MKSLSIFTSLDIFIRFSHLKQTLRIFVGMLIILGYHLVDKMDGNMVTNELLMVKVSAFFPFCEVL